MMKIRDIRPSQTCRTISEHKKKQVSPQTLPETPCSHGRNQRLIALLDEAIALTEKARVDLTASSK